MNATSISTQSAAAPRVTTAKADIKAASTAKQAAPTPPEPSVKVSVSSAAKAALAAAQSEALETPQQTAKEARGNDHQAQRLVTQEELRKTRTA